jgi:hypothetical protein
MTDSTLVTRCHCGDDKDHLIDYKFFGDEWTDMICVGAAMNHYLPWYKRMGIAFKYLFGIDNTYCHYVESLYDKETAVKLRDWLNDVIPKMK